MVFLFTLNESDELYDTCFLESSESAVLFDCAKSASRESDYNSFFEFRNIYALFLEVDITTNVAARIVLCSTSGVGVPTSHN